MSAVTRSWLACCTLLLLASGAGEAVSGETPAGAVQEKSPDGMRARFKEFLDRVNEYDKLRNSLRGGIPEAGKKATAEQIQKHQEMLAAKIEEARKDAKQGDIFIPDSQKAFRDAIGSAHSGKHARKIDRTIVQREPVKLDLYVNKPYPDKIPVTTVPPTLLQHFPKLPKKIEYRIVGDDLVLEDTESRLVIDIFPGAFPNAPPRT
jgi:hypothetical protein